MVVDINGRWYLSGVILSELCAEYEGLSGVYTRVTAFEDWLAPIFEGDDPDSKYRNISCSRKTMPYIIPYAFLISRYSNLSTWMQPCLNHCSYNPGHRQCCLFV